MSRRNTESLIQSRFIAWRTHLKSCCNRQHAICKTTSEAIAIATDYLGLDAWKAREK